MYDLPLIDRHHSIFCFSIGSIILSRFILDLRSIYSSDADPTLSNENASALQFAAGVEGNMGATLSNDWFSGRQRNTEEDEEIQYADSPFGAGLLSEVGSKSSQNSAKRVNQMEDTEEECAVGEFR